jgi:cardiolipin synthase
MTRRRKLILVGFLAGAALASGATVVVLNLTTGTPPVEHEIHHRIGVTDAEFVREMGLLLGPPILSGNTIEHLENGEEIFPAMLEAIGEARRSITFETYIYWSGRIGQDFAAALSDRARAGVAVHVMLDWVGSQKMDERLLEQMQNAGVEVERYHPLEWYTLPRMNNRTHRKLLVVDGRIGFTGGVGIADKWLGDADDPDHWRDSHYRITGPAVAQMQAAFLDNWIETTGRVLTGPDYFPDLQTAGDVRGQLFTSGPSGGGDSMQLMYLLSLAAAERSIDLSAAYFVPDALTRQVMIDAANRGVRVRVIVPGDHIDTDLVRHASRADWGPMLEAGIEIHEYAPTMFHCKMLVVDEYLTAVGSTNFDNRSFRLNDEGNLNVYDAGFGAEMTRVFQDDLSRSDRVTFQEWRSRPWRERAAEWLADRIDGQL